MPILFFKASDEYGYFSNFAKYSITVNNIIFNCNEQFIMYTKAKMFNDEETATLIMQTNNPREIKRLGRLVKNFNQKEWENNVNTVADVCNLYKFSSHPQLRTKLLETGNEVIAEASPYDNIWGIGVDSITGKDITKWKGKNILGNSLMRVREIIRK